MTVYQCEHCGGVVDTNKDYGNSLQCPTCGADMDRVEYAGAPDPDEPGEDIGD